MNPARDEIEDAVFHALAEWVIEIAPRVPAGVLPVAEWGWYANEGRAS